MLSPIKTLHPALEIVRSHHERWDGTGYPDGLKENAIPLAARIFSIVDVFDALISKRPYKQALSKNEALFIVQSQRGHQFDPNLVDHFISNFSSLEREVEDELNHENLDH
jgi:response regulator RpfG family c-di-GMP phosphodiesterase